MGRSRAPGAVAALALLVGAVVGLVMPRTFAGAAGWSLAVLGVLYGLGGIVRRAFRVELLVGEQLLVGAVGWIFASGLLLAASLASRGPLFGIAAIGLAMGLVEVLAWRAPKWSVPTACYAALVAFLALVALSLIGSQANPYDDQVAYVGMVKRLLDVGNLTEPFSFRRMSAYGGQTTLQALAALRGDVATINLLDRGLFQLIGVLVLVDVMRRRALHLGVMVAVVGFQLVIWELAINSAAIWTGYACFVGAYAFASRDDAPLPLSIACLAAMCTLRQNYLVPAGLFALILIVRERRRAIPVLAAAGAIVVPYMIAAFRDCGSFLYPVLLGNGDPAAPLRPTGGSLLDELRFLMTVLFNAEPIRIWWLLAPLMLLVEDTRARKPWPAMLAACLVGFAFLIHSFMLSDAFNLWRYAWAYMTPLAVLFLVEVGAQLDRDVAPLRASKAIAVLAAIAMATQLTHLRGERYTQLTDDLSYALGMGVHPDDPRLAAVETMQAAIPAGARVVAMIDDPWLLDFDRNHFALLDLPGFIGPGGGLPSFTDATHWRSYLVNQGYRYLAFTDGAYSGWLYRRDGWVPRIYNDDELFRYIAAHAVDALDTLAELAASSPVLFHANGMWVVDLGASAPPEGDRGKPEIQRQDAFVRHISEDEFHDQRWQLASRSDVAFAIGPLGPAAIAAPPGQGHEVVRIIERVLKPDVMEPPHRWLAQRTLIRVHGHGAQRLQLSAFLDELHLATHATLGVYLDDSFVAQLPTDDKGLVHLDAPVTCDGWCDLRLVVSTVTEWWGSPSDMRVAELLGFQWTPR